MVKKIYNYLKLHTATPTTPTNLCVWGIVVRSMSTLCGMRGSAGPGDDERRKWVSMDDWIEMEGEKNGQRKDGAERSRAGTGRCPSGSLQVAH